MMKTNRNYKVVIIGGGPAGCASALWLLRKGIKPLIIEKDSFPRFHIGESLTGECGNNLRDLGLGDFLDKEQKFPVKFGVKVAGAGGTNSFWLPVMARSDSDGSLVGNTTYSLLRSSLDDKLLKTAVERGAELIKAEALSVLENEDAVTGVKIRHPDGTVEDIQSEVVVDASGLGTFLANRGITGKKHRGRYDKQIALFSQFSGAIRDSGTDPSDQPGNTLIFYKVKHHWAWFIPVSEEMTSVGVVMPSEHYKTMVRQGLTPEEILRTEMETLNSELTKRVTDVKCCEEVRTASNYSYEVEDYAGPGFICVGDSHRFVDPIFSFGVCFAFMEARLAAGYIQDYLSGKSNGAQNPFAEYSAVTTQGQNVIQDMIDCFWDYPLVFLRFAHVQFRDSLIDIFAGRVYGEEAENCELRVRLRALVEKTREMCGSNDCAVVA